MIEHAIADIMEICQTGKDWHKWTEQDRRDSVVKYRKVVNEYGTPVLRKTTEGNYSILFSKHIDVDALRKEAIDRKMYRPEQVFDRDGNNSGTITKWVCPLCQSSPYLMRVLHPLYPAGFLDQGGVLQQCVCTESRVRERRKLYSTKGKNKAGRLSAQKDGGATKDEAD